MTAEPLLNHAQQAKRRKEGGGGQVGSEVEAIGIQDGNEPGEQGDVAVEDRDGKDRRIESHPLAVEKRREGTKKQKGKVSEGRREREGERGLGEARERERERTRCFAGRER